MLQNEQTFPTLTFDAVGGGSLDLPGDLRGAFGVILFYRGAWCPFCREQLAGFATATDDVEELGIKIAAVSVEDEATGAKLRGELNLPFPVGHSADADRVAAAVGAYANREPRFLQPTGFILAPAGTVRSVVYSSGAVGRLTASEVIRFVGFIKSQAKST